MLEAVADASSDSRPIWAIAHDFDGDGRLIVVDAVLHANVGAYSGYPWTAGLEPLRRLLEEIDHIDGMLFVDRLSPLKRDLLKRRLKKRVRDGWD